MYVGELRECYHRNADKIEIPSSSVGTIMGTSDKKNFEKQKEKSTNFFTYQYINQQNVCLEGFGRLVLKLPIHTYVEAIPF